MRSVTFDAVAFPRRAARSSPQMYAAFRGAKLNLVEVHTAVYCSLVGGYSSSSNVSSSRSPSMMMMAGSNERTPSVVTDRAVN